MQLNIEKYGEWIIHNGKKYLLTNYRATIYDYEQYGIDIRKKFNTEEECAIIAKHFNVFQVKIDMPTRSQMVRHRVNWQELSRRYVSGKRVPFEFYVSEKMKDLKLPACLTFKGSTKYNINMEDFLELSIAMYEQALKDGVKPEEARRIIPQACYTQIWGGFQPTQLDNFLKLRLDSHSQWEITRVAEAMKSLVENNNG